MSRQRPVSRRRRHGEGSLPRRTAQRRDSEPARSSYILTALDYAQQVCDGTQPVSRHVRLACEIFLRDYFLAVAGKGPWEFREDLATDAMAFAEALSDDGSITGRGSPWARGAVTGVMTAVYRMTKYGWSEDKAYSEMKQYKFETFWGHPELRHFVHDYFTKLTLVNSPMVAAAPLPAAPDPVRPGAD